MRVRLSAPERFSFRRTVLSHGWCTLAPFEVDRDGDRISTVVALPDGGAAPVRLTPDAAGVLLETPGRPPARVRRHLAQSARRMLNLDLDLSPFYERVERDAGLRWIAETGSGRMLRCPTVFEDLLKLVLTTNCSWALTQKMNGSIVRLWGEAAPDGRRAFPTAAALARAGEGALRSRARTGYRAPLLAALLRRVAAGRVAPETWEGDPRDPAELKRELLDLPGVGPYVAENLLKLLGRPAGLALDSWLRAKYARLYHGGRRVTDRTIARRYARFGEWAGMAIWCEMTRDWFDGDEPSAAWRSLS